MTTADRQTTRPGDDNVVGPSRRTVLAAERTWLAWWRTAIAVTGVAIAVGGLIPHLVDGSRAPYLILGAGYALLAIAIFTMAAVRHREVTRALTTDANIDPGMRWIYALTIAGGMLALATLIVVLVAR